MKKLEEGLFAHPFSKAYWKQAASEMKDLRMLLFASLMVAVCIGVSMIPALKIHESLSISWTYLVRAICVTVCGPVVGTLFAIVEDTASFFIAPPGAPYFIGYMFTTIFGNLIYALLLYRTKITVLRICVAKLLTNIMNVFLGSLWSSILYSKGYLYYMTTSAVKNSMMFPVQAILLALVLGKLLPILRKSGYITYGDSGRLPLY